MAEGQIDNRMETNGMSEEKTGVHGKSFSRRVVLPNQKRTGSLKRLAQFQTEGARR
jgi:hypothetical protein